ncbi:MAG: FGGY-family carbohydrate kinase, partial [Desulfobulbia bacterium]
LLYLQSLDAQRNSTYCMHQADWIAGQLMRLGGHSDENNVLKLGYDLEAQCWPHWFEECGVRTELLPHVHGVGQQIGIAENTIVRELGFSVGMKVIAGTTDSNAAFLAAGARKKGEGVTSLGTTLAIKYISDKSIQSVEHGIYSHRIGNLRLAGGASNSGGAALLKYFSIQEIETLSNNMDANQETGLDYYPLPKIGERFPINDPYLEPREIPRPEDDQIFLQAMFEGIARIEAKGYALLEELGAPKLTRIFTSGGGAKNRVWTEIRSRINNVPTTEALNVNPAYGSALLAKGIIPNF